MESPLDVLSRAASMVNQSERLETNGRLKSFAAERGEHRITSNSPQEHVVVRADKRRAPDVTAEGVPPDPVGASYLSHQRPNAAVLGQWHGRPLPSMHADLGDLQGPAGLPAYGWMAHFDKRLNGLRDLSVHKAENASSPVADHEPLNLSRKSTASEALSRHRSSTGQPINTAAPSVFTSVSAMATSDKLAPPSVVAVGRRDVSSAAVDAFDPAIEEHFRRSLGGNYGTAPTLAQIKTSQGRVIAESVDDHFEKSLGATWQKINLREGSEKKSKSGGIRRRAQTTAEGSSGTLSVDDHFSKALGDKWLELQKSSDVHSTAAVAPANTSTAKRQKLTTKPCS